MSKLPRLRVLEIASGKLAALTTGMVTGSHSTYGDVRMPLRHGKENVPAEISGLVPKIRAIIFSYPCLLESRSELYLATEASRTCDGRNLQFACKVGAIMAKAFISSEVIEEALSDANFVDIERQFDLCITPDDRSCIRDAMSLVAGQIPWLDPSYVRDRMDAAERIARLVRKIAELMDSKVLLYRGRSVEWDDDEDRFRTIIDEMQEYFDNDLKELGRGQRKKTGERDLLETLFIIYEDSGGKGKGISRIRKEGKLKRKASFIDFVNALCLRIGANTIPVSLWEDYRREKKRRESKANTRKAAKRHK